ncbi:hypothetical protein MTO96_008894 [Rhipicephalus appendiculatus]
MSRSSAVVCALFGISRPSTSTENSTPQHIIIILADDIGWNDVSFHGSRQIPTPNIDALAATGVILQRHYSASTCTPSRTALLASVYPARTNVGYVAYPPASEQSLSLRFELLPQWLKRLGYSTHLIGKWHLGYSSVEHTPTWRGFDTFFGYYNFGGFYFNHSVEWQGHCGVDLWYNVGRSIQPVTHLNGVYSTHAFTRRARKIIAEHDVRKPLFLFFSHQGIHATCDNCTAQAPRENIDKFAYIAQHNRTVLAGALDVLDESCGASAGGPAGARHARPQRGGVRERQRSWTAGDRGQRAAQRGETTGLCEEPRMAPGKEGCERRRCCGQPAFETVCRDRPPSS